MPGSAFPDQLLDAPLQLALLLFAGAQARVEIGGAGISDHGAEGEPQPVGLAPDHPGEIGATLAGNGEVDLLRQACVTFDFDTGAVLAEIAHHAIDARTR